MNNIQKKLIDQALEKEKQLYDYEGFVVCAKIMCIHPIDYEPYWFCWKTAITVERDNNRPSLWE